MDTGEAGFAALADGIDGGVGGVGGIDAAPAITDPELARMATVVAALRRTSSAPSRIRQTGQSPSAEFRVRLRARLLTWDAKAPPVA